MVDAQAVTAPAGFESWEQCRDYYALEAIFLGQLFDQRPGPRNKERYMAAAEKAVAANKQCAEPLPMDEDDFLTPGPPDA